MIGVAAPCQRLLGSHVNDTGDELRVDRRVFSYGECNSQVRKGSLG